MFLSHNIVFKGKNQAKVMYFMKLAILIFGCPGDMHITNFTRMPLVLVVLEALPEDYNFSCTGLQFMSQYNVFFAHTNHE